MGSSCTGKHLEGNCWKSRSEAQSVTRSSWRAVTPWAAPLPSRGAACSHLLCAGTAVCQPSSESGLQGELAEVNNFVFYILYWGVCGGRNRVTSWGLHRGMGCEGGQEQSLWQHWHCMENIIARNSCHPSCSKSPSVCLCPLLALPLWLFSVSHFARMLPCVCTPSTASLGNESWLQLSSYFSSCSLFLPAPPRVFPRLFNNFLTSACALFPPRSLPAPLLLWFAQLLVLSPFSFPIGKNSILNTGTS